MALEVYEKYNGYKNEMGTYELKTYIYIEIINNFQ